jgi:hypothetical protein
MTVNLLQALIIQYARLQFRSLIQALANTRDVAPGLPRLPSNRTYCGRGKNDETDPYATLPSLAKLS